VRAKICRDKATADEWLAVHRTAHRMGLRSNCTMLYGLLGPIVDRMQPRVGRVLAVILCYLVILGALWLFFGTLVPALVADLAKLRDALPAAAAKLNEEWLPRFSQWVVATFGDFAQAPAVEPGPPPNAEVVMVPLGDGSWKVDLEGVRLQAVQQGDGAWLIGPPTEPAKADFARTVREMVATRGAELTALIGPVIQKLVAGVAGFVTSFVITFMIAAFMLVDLARIKRFARSLVPPDNRGDFDVLWKGMDKGLGGVVRGQLLICLVNGVLTFIGLVIFDIKYSILLALMAGTFSLIPIFGTIISSIPIIVIALVSGESGLAIAPALGILAWIVGIHLLEANVLNPKIIGDAAHIHPIIVVFALLAGEHVFGLVGALLAVPVVSIVQVMFLYARKHSPVFSRDAEPQA
jgi:predicted PurR-regulated permease PerM